MPEQAIGELWYSRERDDWRRGLDRYWNYITPENLALEKEMESVGREWIQGMGPDEWFTFLLERYFRWKYTAANRYKTSTAQLLKADSLRGRAKLDEVRKEILAINPTHSWLPIDKVRKIPGLGAAGASGLLALLYPNSFATVDQFVVKALREVPGLPMAAAILAMREEALTSRDAGLLIGIMRDHAAELTASLGTPWRPRDIDKILWTYGRGEPSDDCKP